MIRWSDCARLTVVLDYLRILPGKHLQGFLVEAEAHILRGNVQHAVGIVGKVSKVGVSEFFAKKRAERKSGQPFQRHFSSLLRLAGTMLHRDQFLQGSKIIRSSLQRFCQMALGLAQVALSSQ